MQDNNEIFSESVKSRDIVSINSHLEANIDNITNKITNIREAIITLEEKIMNETNSDEILHLQYDLDELKKELKKLKHHLNDNN